MTDDGQNNRRLAECQVCFWGHHRRRLRVHSHARAARPTCLCCSWSTARRRLSPGRASPGLRHVRRADDCAARGEVRDATRAGAMRRARPRRAQRRVSSSSHGRRGETAKLCCLLRSAPPPLCARSGIPARCAARAARVCGPRLGAPVTALSQGLAPRDTPVPRTRPLAHIGTLLCVGSVTHAPRAALLRQEEHLPVAQRSRHGRLNQAPPAAQRGRWTVLVRRCGCPRLRHTLARPAAADGRGWLEQRRRVQLRVGRAAERLW